ncbi:MAG: hypothetical protein WCQ21_01180 [Verrucomicrobiota bacterium]
MNRLIRSLLASAFLLGGPAALLAQPISVPLSLDQNAFLYRVFSGYTTNTPPGVNWQSQRGVPISTNALDAGSDGRAPTVAQQISYGTSYPTAPPTLNQFRGWVSFSAVPVAKTPSQLNTNSSFAQNVVALDWPRVKDAGGNTIAILRASEVAAPYMVKQSSYPFGSVIPMPTTDETGVTLTNNPNYWFAAPYSSGTTNTLSFYYSPHAQSVFATQPGQVSIVWEKTVPSSTRPTNLAASVGILTNGPNYYILYTNNYLVSGEAVKTPQKMYWTEGGHAATGHPVSVPSGVRVVNVIYNNIFPQYSFPGDSTTGITNHNTLWYETSQNLIKADNVTGRAFVELLGEVNPDGTRRFLGFEIVDIFSEPVPTDINVQLGTRIPAYQAGGDDSQLTVAPVQNTTQFFHRQAALNSANVTLYATRETFNLNDFQAYWLVTGVAGLQWPLVFNRYHEYWPADPAEYVNYVRPWVGTQAEAAQTAAQLPAGEAPSIAYQDDPDHARAFLSSGGQFYTFLDLAHPAHRTLLQFLSGDNIAYERVFSWLDVGLKTNSLLTGSVATNLNYWDPTNLVFSFPDDAIVPYVTTNTVQVGDRIVAPAGEIGSEGTHYLAGYIIQTNGNSFNPGAYLDPFAVGFTRANQGAIIPVNAIPGNNALEVLWFRSDHADGNSGFQSSYWPAIIGHYILQWPANAPEIILASNVGSGPLDSLQANGTIYRQADPTQPGYNPNEEHAVMLGGQAFALRDDLNNTNAGSYTSDPFILIDYTGSDGCPAMAPFHVRREAPEQGVLFDYVVEAATLLQAPMPLPLLDPPVEGDGAYATNYNTAPPATSGDLPAGWNNSLASSVISNYAGFTYQDRKHEFWVYRGLNSGLPSLQVGAYNPTNNSFDPLPAATAVLNQPFNYLIHVSRPAGSLTMVASNLPSGLSLERLANGYAIIGIPQVGGSNACLLATQDTGDNSVVTNRLSINVLTNGTVVALGPLAITSTNQYSGANVTYSNRVPFLAQPPTQANSFTMRFYYKNHAGFDWPGLADPGVGAIVPYLRPKGSVADPASKTSASLDIVYRPVWPSLVNGQPIPTLSSGETLTVPKHNLASVRGQSSVQVLYQQSIALNTGSTLNNSVPFFTNQSVTLFDPTVQKVSYLPAHGLTVLPAGVNSTTYQGRSYFPNLPPNLVNRLYFDPTTSNLVLQGQFVDEPVGEKYLLLNVLAGADLAAVQGLCPRSDPNHAAWVDVITDLSTSLYTFHEDPATPGSYVVDTNQTLTKYMSDLVAVTSSDQSVDSYALSATGPGLGFITYIVGNTINPTHAGERVSVYIARVAPPLYPGEVKVILDPNPLSEVLSFQHTADLAGKSANNQYDWRIAPPVAGQPPTTDPTNWTPLTPVGNDLSHFTFGGASGIQSLGDNYVTLRYREIDAGANPANTNWSQWTGYPKNYALAEGYIKRVLAGINPFNQRTSDLFDNPVNTTGNIISQAGHRWEGDVALNASTIQNAGLIEIYETLLHRGEALSINGGYNYGPANDALLLAAGYLSDLYSMVANDALADAANPTIGIGTSDKTYGSIATALFAFKGQEPSLLEEELALLRGRDDSLSPGVTLSPVYNRLYWNYTRGIDAGEVIYALNYNILDENNDGVVNAADAATLFPMGHGDAYGHYLTALFNYYQLLINPNFDWVPQIEAVNILGAAVSVGYEHERKFAATAAALARTGLQVFDLTWRKDYQSGTSGGWSYFDAAHANPSHTYTNSGAVVNVTRYWGMDHWAARTGQGAYLNWMVGNAILPPVDPDPTHQGIQKVDRTTVPELSELPQAASQLQIDMNNAEAGFTPLNLAQNAIPFDIDPLLVTGPNPKTHFEQIYQRAVVALNNAVVAFDDAQNVTQLMRSEEDSLANLQHGVASQELAYNNQLIELYGTPYPDDMGPGKTYAQDYNGPDLIHYTYVENSDANTYGGMLPDPTISHTYYLDLQKTPSDWSTNMYDNFNFIVQTTAPGYYTSTNVVRYVVGANGFFDKPPGWTSQRASPGSIQQAISPLISAQYALRQAAKSAQGDKSALDKAMNVFTAQITASSNMTSLGNDIQNETIAINALNAGYNVESKWNNLAQKSIDNVYRLIKDGVPEEIILGTANGGDQPKLAKEIAYAGFVADQESWMAGDAVAYSAYQIALAGLQTTINSQNQLIANTKLDTDTKNGILAIGAQEGALKGDLVNINQKLRALSDAQAAYQALVAKGNRLKQERLSYRQHAAALVQGYRTRDAAFRVFQNEKLERYKTLFDLAAKYAFLAAQAYDYETGLLGTSQAQSFLNRIISARALGVVNNGLPQYAGSDTGDPGLSSALAEMKADWDVLKGRLGFNNPDGYGTTVSLRTENYRILPGSQSDTAWQQVLQQGRVADLRTDSDVKRNCLQIEDGSGLPVPGIILTFSTTVANGLNLFGNPLASGDHTYSASSFATKIFASGVCLDGYIGMENPAAGGGVTPADPTLDPNALAATPYVYLIPVGADSMRSPPLGDVSTIRTWNVDDVAIPLPFNVSAAAFSSTPFYTAGNSLSEPLFAVREHQAFRPVSTTSVFNTSIYGASGALQPSQYTNKRLIGRSIWNSKWKLVIPGRNLLADPNQGLDRLIQSVKDVHLYFITYSYAGN